MILGTQNDEAYSPELLDSNQDEAFEPHDAEPTHPEGAKETNEMPKKGIFVKLCSAYYH